MRDYWCTRKQKLEEDLDHVKRHMKQAKDPEEKEYLQEVYAGIYEELEVAKQAIHHFS